MEFLARLAPIYWTPPDHAIGRKFYINGARERSVESHHAGVVRTRMGLRRGRVSLVLNRPPSQLQARKSRAWESLVLYRPPRQLGTLWESYVKHPLGVDPQPEQRVLDLAT